MMMTRPSSCGLDAAGRAARPPNGEEMERILDDAHISALREVLAERKAIRRRIVAIVRGRGAAS
jgi:hypothetical protein